MGFSENERAIVAKALKEANANKKRIARELTSKEKYPSEGNPVSVFMAGSPGAGKTEASKMLIEELQKDSVPDGGEPPQVLRIDADELRSYFEDYDGSNSVLFQAAASTLLNKVHDLALKNSQSFILDGTLSKYGIAEENIERSLKRDRSVIILYVYQTPERAWEFVQEREQVEGRRILPETFVEQYFAARDVVNDLKRKFGKNIQVDLLLKELDGSRKQYKANIDKIDNHISERYSRRELQDRIK